MKIVSFILVLLFSASVVPASAQIDPETGTGVVNGYIIGPNALLARADLSGADLRGANLSGAYLYRADLGSANLSGADLSGANLEDARLQWAYLEGANLEGANLRLADLSASYLMGANLQRSTLDRAYLTGAHLAGANFQEAGFFGTNAAYTIFSEADIRYAIFASAELGWATFTGADVTGASFYQADLRYADVSGVDFSVAETVAEANFVQTNVDEDTNLGDILDAYLTGKPLNFYLLKHTDQIQTLETSDTTNTAAIAANTTNITNNTSEIEAIKAQLATLIDALAAKDEQIEQQALMIAAIEAERDARPTQEQLALVEAERDARPTQEQLTVINEEKDALVSDIQSAFDEVSLASGVEQEDLERANLLTTFDLNWTNSADDGDVISMTLKIPEEKVTNPPAIYPNPFSGFALEGALLVVNYNGNETVIEDPMIGFHTSSPLDYSMNLVGQEGFSQPSRGLNLLRMDLPEGSFLGESYSTITGPDLSHFNLTSMTMRAKSRFNYFALEPLVEAYDSLFEAKDAAVAELDTRPTQEQLAAVEAERDARFTEDQIYAMSANPTVKINDAGNIQVDLSFIQSSDMENFAPFTVTPDLVSVVDGKICMEFPPTNQDTFFFRLGVE